MSYAFGPGAALQVGNRWEEFTQAEQTQMATLAYNMLKEGAPGAAVSRLAELFAGCGAAGWKRGVGWQRT